MIFTDKPKQHLVEFLTRKGMAVRGPEDNKIDIIHFLSPIAAENWPLVTASDYTAYRHLILCRPPFYLHFIFQRLVADLLQLYDIVSLGKYSLVIQTEQCNYRLDLGPCLVNKTVAEIRVTVRASTQDLCAVGVEHIVDQLRGLLNEIMDPSEVAVKVSCSICRRQYHDVPAVHKVAAQENTRLKCAKCGDNKVSPGNLLRGFNETRPFPEMIWNPFPEPSKQGNDLFKVIFRRRDSRRDRVFSVSLYFNGKLFERYLSQTFTKAPLLFIHGRAQLSVSNCITVKGCHRPCRPC